MSPNRTETELGWPEILSALSSRCRTPFGRRRALSLPFQPTSADAREALARVGEARALSEAAIALPLGGLAEVEPLVDRATRGGVLEPLALRECAALVRAAVRTREVLRARAAEAPRLWAVAEPLTEHASLADRIERAIEPSGTVSERASPALAQARERSRGLHRALKVQVETLLGDPEMERHLRDRYFTIRNERYVLPVLASARSAVPGIVHNASQSGQTLFVEPDSMVELGNELSIANAVALEEEQRILRELSEALGHAGAALAQDLGALGALDVLEASAQLASDLDAHPPDVAPVPAGFELLSLRHPLLVLQGKKVVEPRPARAARARPHRLGPERRREDRRHHRGRPLRADAPRRPARRGGRRLAAAVLPRGAGRGRRARRSREGPLDLHRAPRCGARDARRRDPGLARARGRDRRGHRSAGGCGARGGDPRVARREGGGGARHDPPRRAEGARPHRPALCERTRRLRRGEAPADLPAPPRDAGQLVGDRGRGARRAPACGRRAGARRPRRSGRRARPGAPRARRGARAARRRA